MTAPTKDGHDWGCVYHLEHDDCTCSAVTERGEHTPGIVERLRGGQDNAAYPSRAYMLEAADLISELVGALEKARRFVCCNNNFAETVRRDALAEIDAVATKARGGAE